MNRKTIEGTTIDTIKKLKNIKPKDKGAKMEVNIREKKGKKAQTTK